MDRRSEPDTTMPADRENVVASVASDAEVLASRRYELLGELARGGTGRILRARDRVFDRIVAIKEPLDPACGSSRLRAEGAILARLQHPSIVPVYDAGLRADGVPFFAMKLVHGRSLREAIDDASTLELRIALVPQLVAVSEAVAYAHAAGVIHRDLKPANVLVGAFGETIVIDWGLAKRIEGADDRRAPDRVGDAHATATGEVVGTPAYLSPEQARGEPVDARTDVYALGAILYHLLAGQPPYVGATARDVVADVVAGPATPIDSVQPRAPADLVAIVTKAMARDPADRYPSAERLADDLVRFQTGRLVAARRYSPIARLRYWILQHRFAVTTIAVAAASAGAAYAVVPGTPAPGAQCDAAGDRSQLTGVWDEPQVAAVAAAFFGSGRPYAVETFVRVSTRLDEYTGKLRAARVEACRATHARGEQSQALLDLRMTCLDRRAGELSAFVHQLAANPEVLPRAMNAVSTLTPIDVCADTDALSAVRPLPDDPIARATAEGLARRIDDVQAMHELGRWAAAREPALAIVRDATTLGHAPTLARALLWQARVERDLKDLPAAEATARRTIAAAASARDSFVEANAWAVAINALSSAARHADALALRTAAEAAATRSGDPRARVNVSHVIAVALREMRRFDEAEVLLRELIQMASTFAGDHRVNISSLWNTLGNVLSDAEKWEPALAAYERSLAMRTEALGPGHPFVAMAMNNLGTVYRERNDLVRARALYESALMIWEASVGREHLEITHALNNLSNVAAEERDYARAEALQRRALAIRERVLGAEHPAVASSLRNLAWILNLAERPAEALPYARRALAIREAKLGPDDPHIATSNSEVAEALADLGDCKSAVPYFERALAIYRAAHGGEHADLGYPLMGLGRCSLDTGDAASAIRSLASARALLANAGDPEAIADIDAMLARARRPR